MGGVLWPERRLFDQVRAAYPDFVLLRQANREVRGECCHAEVARVFAESLSGLPMRMRRLETTAPFARSWSQAAAGPGESALSPEDALRKLHAALNESA